VPACASALAASSSRNVDDRALIGVLEAIGA
jgi:hypothetical protein